MTLFDLIERFETTETFFIHCGYLENGYRSKSEQDKFSIIIVQMKVRYLERIKKNLGFPSKVVKINENFKIMNKHPATQTCEIRKNHVAILVQNCKRNMTV